MITKYTITILTIFFCLTAIGQFEKFDKRNNLSAIMDGSFELKTANLKVVNKRGKVDKVNKVLSFLVFAYDMQMKPAIGIDGVEMSMIMNTGATFGEFFYKGIYNKLPIGSFYIVSNSIYVCPEGKEYLDENIFRVPDLKITVVKE